jgi:hypothetical protein
MFIPAQVVGALLHIPGTMAHHAEALSRLAKHEKSKGVLVAAAEQLYQALTKVQSHYDLKPFGDQGDRAVIALTNASQDIVHAGNTLVLAEKLPRLALAASALSTVLGSGGPLLLLSSQQTTPNLALHPGVTPELVEALSSKTLDGTKVDKALDTDSGHLTQDQRKLLGEAMQASGDIPEPKKESGGWGGGFFGGAAPNWEQLWASEARDTLSELARTVAVWPLVAQGKQVPLSSGKPYADLSLLPAVVAGKDVVERMEACVVRWVAYYAAPFAPGRPQYSSPQWFFEVVPPSEMVDDPGKCPSQVVQQYVREWKGRPTVFPAFNPWSRPRLRFQGGVGDRPFVVTKALVPPLTLAFQRSDKWTEDGGFAPIGLPAVNSFLVEAANLVCESWYLSVTGVHDTRPPLLLAPPLLWADVPTNAHLKVYAESFWRVGPLQGYIPNPKGLQGLFQGTVAQSRADALLRSLAGGTDPENLKPTSPVNYFPRFLEFRNNLLIEASAKGVQDMCQMWSARGTLCSTQDAVQMQYLRAHIAMTDWFLRGMSVNQRLHWLGKFATRVPVGCSRQEMFWPVPALNPQVLEDAWYRWYVFEFALAHSTMPGAREDSVAGLVSGVANNTDAELSELEGRIFQVFGGDNVTHGVRSFFSNPAVSPVAQAWAKAMENVGGLPANPTKTRSSFFGRFCKEAHFLVSEMGRAVTWQHSAFVNAQLQELGESTQFMVALPDKIPGEHPGYANWLNNDRRARTEELALALRRIALTDEAQKAFKDQNVAPMQTNYRMGIPWESDSPLIQTEKLMAAMWDMDPVFPCEVGSLAQYVMFKLRLYCLKSGIVPLDGNARGLQVVQKESNGRAFVLIWPALSTERFFVVANRFPQTLTEFDKSKQFIAPGDDWLAQERAKQGR